jgi:hypothetical protein
MARDERSWIDRPDREGGLVKPRYKERVAITSPVIFTIGDRQGEGQMLDLTKPGCLIESPVSVKKGDYVQLKLFLPGLTAPCAVTLAAVRWSNGSQFGVEFIKMPEHDRHVFNQFISPHLTLSCCASD